MVKFGFFWGNYWEGVVFLNSAQQLTMKFSKFNKSFMITSIYARCNALDRLELWEELEAMGNLNCPWMVSGDFNVILSKEEKLGGYSTRSYRLCTMCKYLCNIKDKVHREYLHLLE